MNTKFYESVLAVMYRGKDYKGQVQGGAMYTIKQTFHKRFHFLAYVFAIYQLKITNYNNTVYSILKDNSF